MGPNNLPIKSVNTKWLHSKIALVSQEPVLFGGNFSLFFMVKLKITEIYFMHQDLSKKILHSE
jgi:ABC-type bacteriocin/lantibiotic exporter with double-glycine peptidase domain